MLICRFDLREDVFVTYRFTMLIEVGVRQACRTLVSLNERHKTGIEGQLIPAVSSGLQKRQSFWLACVIRQMLQMRRRARGRDCREG